MVGWRRLGRPFGSGWGGGFLGLAGGLDDEVQPVQLEDADRLADGQGAVALGARRARQASRPARTVPPPTTSATGQSTGGATAMGPSNSSRPASSRAIVPPPANTPMPGANSSAANRAAARASSSSPARLTGSTDSDTNPRTSRTAPMTPPRPMPGEASS